MNQIPGDQRDLPKLLGRQIARQAVDDAPVGESTIRARKLFEIVRALPDGSQVTVSQSGETISA